jgi:hypothetical protein
MDTKKIFSSLEEINISMRREMGLIEPDYGKWPHWFLGHIIHASKRGKVDQEIRTKTEASMHREWGNYWLDHWGTIERNGFELFVSEPYRIQPADAERAIEFAKAIDMPIQIDYAMGWHAPGETDRIIIGGKL